MKKIILSLCCIFLVSISQLSFASNTQAQYKGMAYAAGKINLKKIGIYPTDIIIINNTPDTITLSVPGVYKDYIGGNQVYRLTNKAALSPEIVLGHYAYGSFYDEFVQPHSIISFSIQQGTANTLTVEYY